MVSGYYKMTILSHEAIITNAPNARMPPLISQCHHRETPRAGVSGTPLAPRPVPFTTDHPPSQPAAGAQPAGRVELLSPQK
ncbi:hypothetical protein EOD39_14386 [Acipenser ruthenus]|uniref:Uncharacterized protein n=1 Tax=Acipenser ruthenus TaxID=7906 RepID=A0A444UG12_ACIRT|nr:hypothetical protein EOD39_14386 [Acipenser ruthenus]